MSCPVVEGKKNVAINKDMGHTEPVVHGFQQEVNKKSKALLVSNLIGQELRASHKQITQILGFCYILFPADSNC